MAHRIVSSLGNLVGGTFSKQGDEMWSAWSRVDHNLNRYADLLERDPKLAWLRMRGDLKGGATAGAMYGAAGGMALEGINQMEQQRFNAGGLLMGGLRGMALGGGLGAGVGVGRNLLRDPHTVRQARFAARPSSRAAAPVPQVDRWWSQMESAAERMGTSALGARSQVNRWWSELEDLSLAQSQVNRWWSQMEAPAQRAVDMAWLRGRANSPMTDRGIHMNLSVLNRSTGSPALAATGSPALAAAGRSGRRRKRRS